MDKQHIGLEKKQRGKEWRQVKFPKAAGSLGTPDVSLHPWCKPNWNKARNELVPLLLH